MDDTRINVSTNSFFLHAEDISVSALTWNKKCTYKVIPNKL